MTRILVAQLALTAVAIAAVSPSGPAAADSDRGEQLFGLCQQCHGADGGGMELSLAPAIAGMDLWYVEAQLRAFQSGLRGTHPMDIPGMRMHPMARWLRTDDDLKAVAAYVSQLPRTEPEDTVDGDAKKGEALYATCSACHGPKAEGMQAMNAPALRGSSDWYLYSTLKRFKEGGRGDNPKNANAAMMKGMSNMLADDESIRNVIEYIQSLD